MDVGAFVMVFFDPESLSLFSNFSRAIPGPHITNGISSLKTMPTSFATSSKKAFLTEDGSFTLFPPPLIENCETSLIPLDVTSNTRISSDSTTISPALALVPDDIASSIRSRSDLSKPPSLDISISSPGDTICV